MPNPSPPALALPVITGTAVLDLTALTHEARRYEAACLAHLPHGARIELHVGVLDPSYDVVHFTAEAAVTRSLTVDVHGDHGVIGAWMSQLRTVIAARLAEPFDSTPPRRRLEVVRQQPRGPWESR